MSQLNAKKRSQLPKSAFAYVDSKGRRRLPINDEPHVRNALARFNQVAFEDDAARERARKRLLSAAKKYRSEEHTSELQSLRHLVCRLLLEKKKVITERVPDTVTTL